MKLTSLGRNLLSGMAALTVLSLVGAASYHIISGSMKGSSTNAPSGPTGSASTPTLTVATGELGTPGNPLKVSFVSFHGYAPALLANGNSLTTQPGSIYDKEGLSVEFLIQDDIPTLATNFGTDTVQCSWRTIDFWAQEQPGLIGSGYDGRMVMVVDNTRGGDAVVARGDINSIEDLAGKKVALLQYTPSDWLLRYAIDQSSLSGKKKSSIDYVYVNAAEGTAGVRSAFVSKQVDAEVLWEPDLSLSMESDPTAHVIYSTALATNLIYDGMVCDKRVLDAHPDVIQKFVTGWMKGVTVASADKEKATDALVSTEPFFTDLAQQKSRGFISGLYKGILWTDLSENIRVLGLTGDTNHFSRIYSTADKTWREAGAIANPNAPVINPNDAFDYRFVKSLADEDTAAKEASKVPEYTFSAEEQTKAVAQEAKVTKPVSINFDTGSSDLTKRAEKVIDDSVVPLIESMGSAYFTIEGNTDSTGGAASNTKLSKARADAVATYLVGQWEFPKERFKVVGNGPSKPACDEKTWAADGIESLDACQAMNRRTDIAVYAR